MRILRSMLALGLFSAVGWSVTAAACPFCTAIANTLSEDLSKADVTVVARWMDTASNRAAVARGLTTVEGEVDDPLALRDFQIIRVYKGQTKQNWNHKQIRATFRGRPEAGRVFLVFGFSDETINWTTAVQLRPESLIYLDKLSSLPPPGPERLKHFLKYLDHPEQPLADDAYNEFARAPYSEVQSLRPYLDRTWLLERITDARSDARRRQLYLTLLGVCGQPSDATTVLRVMEKLEDPRETGLDAAIACYLTLTKSTGVSTIEERYLVPPGVDHKKALAAIMAIRFHGEEAQLVPRSRLGAALQGVLDRPQLAEMVIPDLARWEVWSAATAVAKLFRSATGENASVRVPAARFLMACPSPEAKQLLAELRKLDPESVRRANTFLPVPPPDAG